MYVKYTPRLCHIPFASPRLTLSDNTPTAEAIGKQVVSFSHYWSLDALLESALYPGRDDFMITVLQDEVQEWEPDLISAQRHHCHDANKENGGPKVTALHNGYSKWHFGYIASKDLAEL
jgi:hypothetical protein